MTEEQISQTIQAIANSFRNQNRAPILATPADVHLEYEEVTFPSLDGVPLEAWFIPRKDSQKLIIVNHPRFFNRYGFPSNVDPWKAMFAAGGNDFEVNYIQDYKILHEAGYNVLTYDMRNFGQSGSGNGSLCTSGVFESRDVVGSIRYVKSRKETSNMIIGLFSRCLGCNSTLHAMARHPTIGNDVKCLVGVQPVSAKVILGRSLELASIPASRINDLDHAFRQVTSFTLDEVSPFNPAKSVSVPTFLYQVRDDELSRPDDVQSMFDNIPLKDKALFWIEGTTKRWDGYTYFSKEPTKMLAWFDKYMR